MGMDEMGIRYGLHATARFVNLDEEQNTSPWSFSALCAPFRSRFRSAEASEQINLRRFVAAPRTEILQVPTSNYLVNATPSSSKSRDNARISPDILCKIQVLASVPEYVNVADSSLPVTLRMRTKDLAEEHCKKLQLTEVSVDILQQEKVRYVRYSSAKTSGQVLIVMYRVRPSAGYLSQYPVPPKNMQPPNLPLRDPHVLGSIYDIGLMMSCGYSEALSRTFSLLPACETGKYKMPNKNYIFSEDTNPEAVPSWYTMDTTIPFLQRSVASIDPENLEWAGRPDLRPSTRSPLLSVLHEAVISLECTYDLDNGEVARERLTFTLPLTFGKFAPRLAPISLDTLEASRSLQQLSPESSFTLPAYSQLYDRDGERKIDYSTPLPLYTPRHISTDFVSSAEDELTPLMNLSTTNTFDDDTSIAKRGLHTERLVLDSVPGTHNDGP